MILNKVNKNQVAEIQSQLTPKMIKEPLFMFFCQDITKREDFINAYLKYYLYEWSEYDTLLCHEGTKCLASLVDPDTFAYKFKGKGARGLKKFRDSSTIFAHRENLEGIIDIIIPPSRESRVLTIYGNPDVDFDAINQLVDEAIKMAQEENFILIYETFSRKLIAFMQHKGFSIASQKQFLNTQFVETVMVFNV